jgi:polar amino acid transport system substrate-binding protein
MQLGRSLPVSPCRSQPARCTLPGPPPKRKPRSRPPGSFRLGLLGTNATNPKDPATGQFRGPAVDVAKEMAARLGVPFEVVAYPSVAELVGSTTKGEWDVVSIGINPDREKLVDFTAPYMQTESGYLVKGNKIATMADVDKPGVRIGVLERGDSDIFLSKMLKNATLTRMKTLPEVLDLLKSDKVDVHANIKTFLIPASQQVPGAESSTATGRSSLSHSAFRRASPARTMCGAS